MGTGGLGLPGAWIPGRGAGNGGGAAPLPRAQGEDDGVSRGSLAVVNPDAEAEPTRNHGESQREHGDVERDDCGRLSQG